MTSSTTTRDAAPAGDEVRGALPRAARPRVRRTVARAVLVVLLVVAGTFLLDPYRNYLLALVGAYLCATAGLGLLVGRSGQLSLGHAALMAAGGYGYALTAGAAADLPDGLRTVLGLLVAVVVAAVVGLLVGLAGARLHGPYLAGLTLALVMALPAITTTVPGLGGDRGLTVPFQPVPDALDAVIALEQWQAWVVAVVAGVVVTALVLVDAGRTGVRQRAVRDDEVAAALAGVPVGRTKVVAFVLSAAAAGVGGALLCFVTQNVSPGAFTVSLSLLLLVGVVVGGVGRLAGAVVGAVLVVVLPWLVSLLTEALPLGAELARRLDGNLALLLFGVLLVVLTVLAPEGVAGAVSRRRAARRRAARRPGREAP
ncbi:branched-chain amino acid ABC transporter permease [Cellulomonas sp. DKR-3]|uniref:Branched-chain amino acid ABC transporter permease n=1 Tax=Cellulomonas fulva TaxID=2835530 RepID=A0ABS5TY11_9CELL|nr:branched-chain amino acid ABC transporter permease [Cellulomonas fulva]MBT0994045.1 branched-chain amino acid ABC transporter permease [Cellulomonas fulva]